MDRVFNMGIGMVVIVDPAHAAEFARLLKGHGINAYHIGEVVKA